MNYFLPNAKISRDQGKVFWWNKVKVIPMFHPAAALRAGAVMQELEASFKKIPELIGEKAEIFDKAASDTPPIAPRLFG